MIRLGIPQRARPKSMVLVEENDVEHVFLDIPNDDLLAGGCDVHHRPGDRPDVLGMREFRIRWEFHLVVFLDHLLLQHVESGMLAHRFHAQVELAEQP